MGPVVATKLYVPKLRRNVVERSRLSELLVRGGESKLTLISAAAGFGKTTLLSEWLATASTDRAVAWLSLDHTDNEPTSFWSHIVTALETAAPEIGAVVEPILRSGLQPNEALLASLLNALGLVPKVIDLVLDDYHAIDRMEIHSGVTFLLEHLPPNLHVVISTRADPALPLARLRARGQLTEIRSSDLRFTADETATYLNDTMGLRLTEKDITVLDKRAEGWIAALQLAAISMQGRKDATTFIAGFAGNNRYIFDYLVEEVLRRQSDEVRSFLLHTCFLDKLSGALCDAVTGGSESRAMLEALDRQNLFVVPLDDHRQWYRYHHLFADVLMTHFVDELRRDMPVLRMRASDWYEQHGERSEAIHHALLGEDFERAAELIELAIPAMRMSRREPELRGWFQALPDELIRFRPVLGVGFIGILFAGGEFDEAERRLFDVESRLAALTATGLGSPPQEVAVVNEEQLAALPGAIEMYRAALAQLRGDLPHTISHAERALALSSPRDHVGRAAASGFLGIAFWTGGDLEAAQRSWTECVASLRRAGHIVDALSAACGLAEIAIAQGRLHQAARVYANALKLLPEEGAQVLQGTADVHAGLSGIHYERGNSALAHEHLLKCQELGEEAGSPPYRYRLRVALAQVRRGEGDLEGALGLLDEAEHHYVSNFFPNIRPVAAMKARLRIAQGQVSEALRWQRDSGVAVADELSYLREFEHVTLSRLLLAQRTTDPTDPCGSDAMALLDRLLDAAQRGARTASVIELLALQALAHQSRNELAAALVPLERALGMAEPEGYVRIFVDEGKPMAALLKVAVKRGILPAYGRRLLTAFGKPDDRKAEPHPDLIEPLSERELDVLRLLRTDLDGPDIARQLMVSVNTMRTHTKNIYEKLGVNNRRSAVRRAEELHMLLRGHRS